MATLLELRLADVAARKAVLQNADWVAAAVVHDRAAAETALPGTAPCV